MKVNNKILLLCILILVSFSLRAQIYNPVSWTFSQKALPNGEAELSFIATIEPGWHMYSQFLPEGGPVVTAFKYKKNPAIQILGKVTEPKPVEEFDKNFNMKLKYFFSKAVFTQKVKVNAAKTTLKGTIEFMSCNDSQCTPQQEQDFEFTLKGVAGTPAAVTTHASSGTAKTATTGTTPVTTPATTPQATAGKDTANKATIQPAAPKQIDTKTDDNEKKSLWGWFFLAFGSGLLAILTPCVFPMIPMTVAFFMNEAKSKAKARMEGVIYGLSIITIYTVIGTVVAITLGANFANFLSTHWIPNVFLFLIFLLMGFYLLGKLKFVHDSEVKHVIVPRLMLAIITFSFVIYMIPGMFGAPLKALSGYMPPASSLDFDLTRLIAEGGGGTANDNKELCETPKFADFLSLPHNLKGYFDYDQALRCSKQQLKPLFVDFTGHGCVNCREMEANVWSDPQVLKHLRENYIVVALYVDDRKDLPQSDWVTSTYDGKVKNTVGKKFADLQNTKFKVNSQPYYVLLDNNGELLNKPKAYDLNVDNFIKFLDDGVAAYKKNNK
jgi:thioredoxin-related protein